MNRRPHPTGPPNSEPVQPHPSAPSNAPVESSGIDNLPLGRLPLNARLAATGMQWDIDDNGNGTVRFPGGKAKLVLGGYIIDKPIGRGTFAVVNLGQHLKTGLSVAIKVIHKSRLLVSKQANEDLARLNREVTIMRKVSNHPNIVRIYELQDTATELYLFNEYCSGGELFDYIVKRQRLSEQDSRSFFQQLISAVCYCHCHSICHRDLKPENIMLNEKRILKMCDFGLSNFNEPGSFMRTFCGSPNYAAPEIVAGKPYVGPEVDIWSCGVILFAMLCGYLPFDDVNVAVLFDKIRMCEFEVPAFLTQPAQNLIKKMIVQDPLRRITLKEIRQHPWFDMNLPQHMKINFHYGPLPPLSALVTRRYLLERYGIPHYTPDELIQLFEIDHANGDGTKLRTWHNLSRSLVLNSEYIGSQQNLKNLSRLSEQLNAARNHVSRSLSYEENASAMDLIDPPLGLEDLDPEIIRELALMEYDVSDPLKVIDPVLRPDVTPSPETVAYHLLMDARKGEARMPLQTAAFIGIAHLSIARHGLPGDMVSDRQKALLSDRMRYYVNREHNNKTFDLTENGCYTIPPELDIMATAWDMTGDSPELRAAKDQQIQTDAFSSSLSSHPHLKSSNSPISQPIPGGGPVPPSVPGAPEASNLPFQLLPIIRVKPQSWSKLPIAFPKKIQGKTAACAVFRNDLDDPSTREIVPSFEFSLRKHKGISMIHDGDKLIQGGHYRRTLQDEPDPMFGLQPKTLNETTTTGSLSHLTEVESNQLPRPLTKKPHTPQAVTRARKNFHPGAPQANGLRTLLYAHSPGVLAREILDIVRKSGFEWKSNGYARWLCRRKSSGYTTKSEFHAVQRRIGNRRNILPVVWGEMNYVEGYNAVPPQETIQLIVQIMSVDIARDAEPNIQHFISIVHVKGPLHLGLVVASRWQADLHTRLNDAPVRAPSETSGGEEISLHKLATVKSR